MAIPWQLLLMGGSSLLGGLLGNRKQEQTSTYSNNSNSTTSSNPVYEGNIRSLRDRLVGDYMSSLENFDNDFVGETINGVSNINSGADASSRLMENILASRGIRGPAAGYAMSMPRIQQQSQTATYLNSLPALKEQRRANLLSGAGSFLSTLPLGNYSSTNTSQSGTQTGTTPGNMAGGGLQSLATMLAGIYGKNGKLW